jgi:C4-dicarboxylate transporter
MKHAFPVAITVVIVVTLATLFAAVWYDGYKEGWRQANEASVPAAGHGHTPPAADPLLRL